MKKALLALALAAATATAFAQTPGDIFFFNEAINDAQGNSYDAPIRRPGGVPVSPADGITAGLFLAGAADSATPIATSAIGNGGIFVTAANVAIPGSSPGQTPQLEVRAWSGPSYAAAKAGAGLWGFDVFTAKPLGGPNPPNPAIFTPDMGGADGFLGVTLVPEPSTYALGLLGLGALAMMRRRKA